MQKAKIMIEINDYIIEKEGIIDKEVLKVKDNEDIISFDIKKLILIKENKEIIITMNFDKKIIKYELVPEKRKFTNNFQVNRLTNYNNQYIINYRIEDSNFLLKINYETI